MHMLHGPLSSQFRDLRLAMACMPGLKQICTEILDIKASWMHEPIEFHYLWCIDSSWLVDISCLWFWEKVNAEVQHGHCIWVASTLSHDWCNWKFVSFGHFDVEYLRIFGMQDCFCQALTSPMEDWDNESKSIHLRAIRGHKCRKNKMMPCHLQTCTQGCCV